MPLIKTIYVLVLLLLFLAAVGGGVILLLRQAPGPAVEISLPTPTPTPQLKVYISGAVASPGVYILKEGDRLADAITAAGGATDDADLSRVNLARRVRDEDHFHIPRVREATPAASTTTPSGGKALININTASVELLETLPGIGAARARAIVDYREKKGPFKSAEDIMKVSGISPAVYRNIRDLISVDGGSP